MLTADGIPHRLLDRGTSWAIGVPAIHRRAAVSAISTYLKENPPPKQPAVEISSPPVRSYSAAYVILALTLIHWMIRPGIEQRLFIDAYGADSRAIIEGQVYRCVTALLFHSNWAHLVSNAFGLAVFGTAVALGSGWGVGWLMILISGILGNLFNAVWYGGDHVSIGASTAVFGAVGICAALTFGARIRSARRSWRDWVPLGAGLALLAFLGASPQTDLLAHMFGFGSGFLIGGLHAWRRSRHLSPLYQQGSAVIAASLVAAAWIAGLSRT